MLDLRRLAWDKLTGLLIVMALHAVGLYALWHYQIRLAPQEALTVFVNFINPPPLVKQEEPPKPKPRPKPVEPEPPPPMPQQIVVEAPVVLPEEPVAPPPPPEPVIETPLEPLQPVQLTTELSVACPERTPPVYPAASRRMGEEGRVVLWVELDEQGRVNATRVDKSSGSSRLDDAALAAVKTWRCTPATRDGMPVRAVALQPFLFILEGR
jgi:protein TonB